MPIYVDSRGEGEKRIAELLTERRYPVEVKHLESGDYVFDEVGIERKTISDLCGSVQSKEKGHSLWEQLRVLKDTYKKPSLLIEGFIDWDDRTVASIIIGVTNGFCIPYYNSLNKVQSAQIIGKIFERYGVARTSKIPPPAVKKGYTKKQLQWQMLQTVPHLGGTAATRVLEVMPDIFVHTYSNLFIEWQLKKVQGLHKEARGTLISFLDHPVKREGDSTHV